MPLASASPLRSVHVYCLCARTLDGLVESACESIVEHRRAQHNLERSHGVERHSLEGHLLDHNILNVPAREGNERKQADATRASEHTSVAVHAAIAQVLRSSALP
jgi:hypothetical protein